MLSALSAHFPEHKICPERLNGLGDWPSAKLSDYDLFAGHFVFDALSLVPDPKVTFTMLREPKARMLSWYYYVRAHPRDHLEKHDPFLLPMRDQSLTEYLASDRATRDGNWMTELIGNSDLDLALARLKQFTALGILEREWATCLNFRLRLGVKIKGLPRENLSRKDSGRRPLTPDMSRRLNDLTHRDAVLYRRANLLLTRQVMGLLWVPFRPGMRASAKLTA
jgi:hypothetical protein